MSSKPFHPSEPSANGDVLLGFDPEGRPVRLGAEALRRGVHVRGSDEALRRGVLLGIAASSVANGRGLVYFCTGDPSDYAHVYAIAARYGRQDDILLLDFTRGFGSVDGILSNTLNPFALGSADALAPMLVSMMDLGGIETAMWNARATTMALGILRALEWLRSEGRIQLDVGAVRDYLRLARIVDLAYSDEYGDMPVPIRRSLESYLTSLPGFVREKGHRQSQTTMDQHGYLDMVFTKTLGNFADVYGHIFATPVGDVDIRDVVLNDRILVVMLPAYEKAPDEVRDIATMVVSNIKGMMAEVLGTTVRGEWADVVDRRGSAPVPPFACIVDEVGYHTASGIAEISAQARSLGFSIVAAAQDAPAMKRLDEKDRAAFVASCSVRIDVSPSDGTPQAPVRIDLDGQTVFFSPADVGIDTTGLVLDFVEPNGLAHDPEASKRFHTRADRMQAFAASIARAEDIPGLDPAPLSFANAEGLRDPDRSSRAMLQYSLALIAGYAKLRSVSEHVVEDDRLVGLGN